MKNNDTLEGNCNSIENLNAYLRQKGKNHNCYKAYTSLSRVVEIRDTKFLYLSNGETWNDVIDRNNFNSATNLVVNYGKCFSFSQDENVAMWMLYGGIDKLSGMIDFTKKGMHSILATNLINVGYFDGDGKFKTEKTLTKENFDIYITDIVYYKVNGNGYYINRSEESYNCLSNELFEKLQCCKKTYPWKYENECRLIVSINKKLITNKCKIVQINLDGMDLGKSFERVYRGPNYPLKNFQNSLPSKLDNTIDWSLCDGKHCINNRKGI